MKQILKWDVPADGKTYEIGGGPVVHVACQYGIAQVVQVWTEEVVGAGAGGRQAFVVGTGHTYEDGTPIGTAIMAGGRLVLHVIEVNTS